MNGWLRRCSWWSSSYLKFIPDWALPLFKLLEKYKLPPCDILFGMDNGVLKTVANLCDFEGLEIFKDFFCYY